MADPKQHDYTPEELRQAKGDYDPSKMVPQGGDPEPGGPPQAMQQDHAQQQAIDEKAKATIRTRAERLVESGRGHHTAGRLGGVK